MTNAIVLSIFPCFAMLAVRPYIAWCFCVSLQEFSQDIVDLQSQLWTLLDRIHFASSWFPIVDTETAYICL